MSKSILKLAFCRQTIFNALPLAIVVGTVLNLINQGERMLAGNGISWFHLFLNYMVPYCVASYAAARNESQKECHKMQSRSSEHDR